ncbi:hypothetical protein D5S17_33480 [Pseudonocardiaceae bacterium YIM PH 21723]|nr:hypothetical protein D5S17_33480 [Pseudonocardiaceae bacterium YIM PH 21723]
MLQGCLNGSRHQMDHPRLPVTPRELAADARDVVLAGAGSLHIHPRDAAGNQTLAGPELAVSVAAVRTAVPGTEISVSTGAWIQPDPVRRVELVRGWAGLAAGRPDLASVNVHEDGWQPLCTALYEARIGVELGIWSLADAHRVTELGLPPGLRRVLIELPDIHGETAVDEAGRILDTLRLPEELPVLLHGADRSAWPVLEEAVRRGLDSRIGLEDALLLPDGSPAEGNSDLFRTAVSLAEARWA